MEFQDRSLGAWIARRSSSGRRESSSFSPTRTSKNNRSGARPARANGASRPPVRPSPANGSKTPDDVLGCGKETTVPFKPTAGGPVFCKDASQSRNSPGRRRLALPAPLPHTDQDPAAWYAEVRAARRSCAPSPSPDSVCTQAKAGVKLHAQHSFGAFPCKSRNGPSAM